MPNILKIDPSSLLSFLINEYTSERLQKNLPSQRWGRDSLKFDGEA